MQTNRPTCPYCQSGDRSVAAERCQTTPNRRSSPKTDNRSHRMPQELRRKVGSMSDTCQLEPRHESPVLLNFLQNPGFEYLSIQQVFSRIQQWQSNQ